MSPAGPALAKDGPALNVLFFHEGQLTETQFHEYRNTILHLYRTGVKLLCLVVVQGWIQDLQNGWSKSDVKRVLSRLYAVAAQSI